MLEDFPSQIRAGHLSNTNRQQFTTSPSFLEATDRHKLEETPTKRRLRSLFNRSGYGRHLDQYRILLKELTHRIMKRVEEIKYKSLVRHDNTSM
jgi:hypothetical protein